MTAPAYSCARDKMKLYIVRHGETDWNRIRRLQGWTDVPLNDFGRELARRTHEGMKDIDFDLCLSSPLSRALETARIILGERDTEIITDDRLLEINVGDYDGKYCRDDNFEIPREDFNAFYNDPMGMKRMPNGECIKDVIVRGTEFLHDILSREDLQDKTILISTHACILRGILNSLYDDPQDFWQHKVPDNCSVSALEKNGDNITFIQKDRLYYEPSLAVNYHHF